MNDRKTAARCCSCQNLVVLLQAFSGVFQSGQMGQTVNLLRNRFGGSNPSAPTYNKRRVTARLLLVSLTSLFGWVSLFSQVSSLWKLNEPNTLKKTNM